ncbi:MAG TPA: hypothetical protein VFB45_17980 [Pseudolabrys sp.]|nr:hypothetical protein [Pseudolabrys sp.]
MTVAFIIGVVSAVVAIRHSPLGAIPGVQPATSTASVAKPAAPANDAKSKPSVAAHAMTPSAPPPIPAPTTAKSESQPTPTPAPHYARTVAGDRPAIATAPIGTSSPASAETNGTGVAHAALEAAPQPQPPAPQSKPPVAQAKPPAAPAKMQPAQPSAPPAQTAMRSNPPAPPAAPATAQTNIQPPPQQPAATAAAVDEPAQAKPAAKQRRLAKQRPRYRDQRDQDEPMETLVRVPGRVTADGRPVYRHLRGGEDDDSYVMNSNNSEIVPLGGAGRYAGYGDRYDYGYGYR